MTYVMVDVYPDIGAEHFVEYAGAAAGCWVREDTARAKGGLARFVEEMMLAAGWRIARTLSTERVSHASYHGNAEGQVGFEDALIGRARFEQALIDGFVAQFHRKEREVIVAAKRDEVEGDEDSGVLAAHERFVQAMRSAGAVSLYSRQDDQWANGVSPDGDEFFPIWIHADSTRAWMHGWPEYEVRALDHDMPFEDMLNAINEANMWAAIEVDRDALVTTHAILLSDLLKRPPRRRAPGLAG